VAILFDSGRRYQYYEPREFALSAFERDSSAIFLNDSEGQAQSQASAPTLSPGGKKRIEYPIHIFFRDTHTIIEELNAYQIIITSRDPLRCNSE